MKRLFCCVLTVLFLTGCGAEKADRIETLQQRYAALAGYTAEVKIDLPREDETLHYTLSLVAQDEKFSARILAPELLKGVTAGMDGETLTLSYEDTVLDALTPCPRLSAMNCVPMLLRSFPQSYVSVRSEESFGARETTRLAFDTEFGGETLNCAIYFAPDDTPAYAEIAQGEKIIVYMEFTNFTFGDILNRNT